MKPLLCALSRPVLTLKNSATFFFSISMSVVVVTATAAAERREHALLCKEVVKVMPSWRRFSVDKHGTVQHPRGWTFRRSSESKQAASGRGRKGRTGEGGGKLPWGS